MIYLLVFVICLFTIATSGPLMCPSCDQNDYNPICAEGKAYGNLCKLKREICLGKVVLNHWKYGKCTVIREPPTAGRTDDHDGRVIFRLFPTRK